ncbi:MAG TPA: DUF423 domain-containing protein [Flavobacteriales bacterium]|nr:DUF423 domain-containing protein [Flavobacteriales bacterium]
MNRRLLAAASLILLIAVILGAFGAHGLKPKVSTEALAQWHTGVEYQFYHGLGLLLLAALVERIPDKVAMRIAVCFILGVVLFSGSLYLLSTRELNGMPGAVLGPITPLGGLCFIVGWTLLLINALRSSPTR